MLFYLLRVVARLPMFGGNWGADDWVMTVAMVCCKVSSASSTGTDCLQILIIPLTICAYLCKLCYRQEASGYSTDFHSERPRPWNRHVVRAFRQHHEDP